MQPLGQLLAFAPSAVSTTEVSSPQSLPATVADKPKGGASSHPSTSVRRKTRKISGMKKGSAVVVTKQRGAFSKILAVQMRITASQNWTAQTFFTLEEDCKTIMEHSRIWQPVASETRPHDESDHQYQMILEQMVEQTKMRSRARRKRRERPRRLYH